MSQRAPETKAVVNDKSIPWDTSDGKTRIIDEDDDEDGLEVLKRLARD